MEKKHKPFIDKLLRRHIKGLRGNPIYTGFNGNRNPVNSARKIRNKAFDELGADVICNIEYDAKKNINEQLRYPNKILVQAKISSQENFIDFGIYRESFVIGNIYEMSNRFIGILISGYSDPKKFGNLYPYVMLDYRVLFTAITDKRFMIYPKSDPRNIDKDNIIKGQWICDEKKPWLWMSCKHICNIDLAYDRKLIITGSVPKTW